VGVRRRLDPWGAFAPHKSTDHWGDRFVSEVRKVDLQITKQPATLRLVVEDRLRAAISAGDFKPGQRLIERELCELTGVGRTSIREALRQLEAEGLITNIPHRGPSVSTITVDEARQLYALRALLEGYAGRCCAEFRLAEKSDALAKAVTAFERAARSGNQQQLIQAKSHFYDVLMDGSGNVLIKQVLTTLHNRITLLRITSMTQPGRLKRSIAEIRTILATIQAGDATGAERACREHVENAAEVAIAYLKKDEAKTGRPPRASGSGAEIGPQPVRKLHDT
jgi:DNA-binding GntR family transcriptional regulator